MRRTHRLEGAGYLGFQGRPAGNSGSLGMGAGLEVFQYAVLEEHKVWCD